MSKQHIDEQEHDVVIYVRTSARRLAFKACVAEASSGFKDGDFFTLRNEGTGISVLIPLKLRMEYRNGKRLVIPVKEPIKPVTIVTPAEIQNTPLELAYVQ